MKKAKGSVGASVKKAESKDVQPMSACDSKGANARARKLRRSLTGCMLAVSIFELCCLLARVSLSVRRSVCGLVSSRDVQKRNVDDKGQKSVTSDWESRSS